MTTQADRLVAALRDHHDTLAALVSSWSEEQLAAPSGATEWTVAQALSHLGSGAEIARGPIVVSAGQQLEQEDNQAIWARWDASSPAEQAAGFVTHDEAYVAAVEALDPEQHASLSIDLGFLPQPVPLVVALGMRLNEVANHDWDVRVGVDPSATVDPGSADLLLDLFGGPLAFLLTFSARPDQIERHVRLAIPSGSIEIADAVTVTDEGQDPTATFEGPKEAVVRLLSGRLRPEHAAGVSVSGNVTLDELRAVFPGY